MRGPRLGPIRFRQRALVDFRHSVLNSEPTCLRFAWKMSQNPGCALHFVYSTHHEHCRIQPIFDGGQRYYHLAVLNNFGVAHGGFFQNALSSSIMRPQLEKPSGVCPILDYPRLRMELFRTLASLPSGRPTETATAEIPELTIVASERGAPAPFLPNSSVLKTRD